MFICFNKKTGENIKIWLDISTIFVTAVLFLFILINPKLIKAWCNRGDFSECNVLGQKLTQEQKISLQQGEQIFGEAIANVNKIKGNLKSLKSNLKTISTDLKPEAKQKNLQEQIKLTTDQINNLAYVEKKLKQGLSELQPLVNENPASGKWAIVFGGDTSHESARTEINKAQKKGYNSADIYYRRNSYRSIITFDSRQLANDALPEIRKLSYHNDAYLVNLENWCPNPTPKQDNLGQYFVCQS